MPQNVKKKKKSIVGKLLGIIFLSVAIFLFVLVGRDVVAIVELQSQSRQIDKELELLKDENAKLKATKDKLEDPNYVATYARGEYMFSKQDEKIFRLPSNNND